MTERRRRKKREEEEEQEEEEVELSDEQNEIAKYLRFNCLTKSSTYRGNKVDYFKGSKAIECLLDSKWATNKKETEALFTDRESARDYLQVLLEHETFKRVIRVRKKKKGDKEEDKKSKDDKDSSKTTPEIKDSNDTEDGKKKKVKVKLEVIQDQVFLDGEEVYMWIFDPIHPRTILYGVLVVIGAVFVCLFPLWPLQMREYVWYVSVAAASALGTLLAVAILRYPVFAAVWVLTAGKHHFWFLPNLMGDCGVKESFIPLYTCIKIKKDEDDEGQDKDKIGQNEDNEDQNIEEIGDQEDDNKDKEQDEDNDEQDRDTDEQDRDNYGQDRDDDGQDRDSGDQPEDNEEQSENKTGSTEDVSKTNKNAKIDKEPWVQVTSEDVAQAKEATELDTSDEINVRDTSDETGYQ